VLFLGVLAYIKIIIPMLFYKNYLRIFELCNRHIGLAIVGQTVLNSTFVILFGFCVELNICTSNSPTSFGY
jgi:hypothetical protein